MRPAQFHITCPELQLDNDIEPPMGPGGPGTYIIGQGAHPAGNVHDQRDRHGQRRARLGVDGDDEPRHPDRVRRAPRSRSRSHVGDDLVLTVTNAFPPIDRPFPELPNRRNDDDDGRRWRARRPPRSRSTTTTSVVVPDAPGASRRDARRRPRRRRLRPPRLRASCRRPALRRADCSSRALVAMLAGLALVARHAAVRVTDAGLQAQAAASSSSTSESIGTRTCSVVSRSRIVTARSSSDSKSTVTASGVPISS